MEEKNTQSAPKEQETVNVIAIVPIELHRKLRHYCFDKGITLSAFVIDAIKALPEKC